MVLTKENIDTEKKQIAETHISKLEAKYSHILIEDPYLTRKLVSFQANKQRPIYRWYKYKEAFSADLIHYLFDKYSIGKGKVLDPFAGTGTALFASREKGHDAYGIELLPIGQEVIKTRQVVEDNIIKKSTLVRIEKWYRKKYWMSHKKEKNFVELKITKGAYSKQTTRYIRRYLAAISEENFQVKQTLYFALLCVLESISFTRKDGQYLRWDYRSGRSAGKKSFDKGHIYNFNDAISLKLNQILSDLKVDGKQRDLFQKPQGKVGHIAVYKSSCLKQLPKIRKDSFSIIVTSPPYCNRYDYTRTYALELAMLGINEDELRSLRQTMLSCTVENKEKDLLKINSNWATPLLAAKKHQALHYILNYLDYLKEQKQLNNDGIIRMIKGYFYEMSCVIYECYKVLKKGGYFFMVNDNVKYAGVAIPVDLILSDLASYFGFKIKNILVLPRGKGNSSQQMGEHGREILRKCVYIWQKE